MRQLLDMYLSADPSRTLSNFGDATLLQLIVENGIEEATGKLPTSIRRSPSAMAETLEANMRKVIIQEMPINPVYYEKMSVLLTELIRQRKLEALDYEQYLKKIEALAREIHPKASNKYPTVIDTGAKRALYDNLSSNEALAVELYNTVNDTRPDNWIGTPIKEKAVRISIRQVMNRYGITDEKEVSRIYDVVEKQEEFK
jgi:type I restriction enzyme R subunit